MNITVKNVPKLRFKEFSGEWIEKNLENVSNISSSKRVYYSDYVDFGIPFYRGKEISELKRGVQPSDILYISEESYYNFKDKFGVPECGDILITAVGTLGNVLRITSNAPFYFKDGNLIWLKNIIEESFFLEYLLDTKKKEIESSSIGSTQRALTIVGLKKLKFSFPSKPEQQKIADFLSSVDKKIQALKQQQQLLLQYKKGMMQKLFSQQIRFKDENGQDYPEWELYKLSDISEINPRNEKLPKEFVYIDLESVEKGNLIHQKHVLLNNAPSRAQRILKKNDILFQLVRPYQQNNFLFNLDNNNYVASTGYAQIRTKQNQEYLYQLLNTDFILNKVLELCTGTSYPAINSNDLGSISFNICSFPEQQKIADCLSAIDQKIELVNKKISYTEQFKQGLLQQLFV